MFNGARASCVRTDLAFQRADLSAGAAASPDGRMLLLFPCQWVSISTSFMNQRHGSCHGKATRCTATGSPTGPCSRDTGSGCDWREPGLNPPSGLGWFQNPSLFCTLQADLLRYSKSHRKLKSPCHEGEQLHRGRWVGSKWGALCAPHLSKGEQGILGGKICPERDHCPHGETEAGKQMVSQVKSQVHSRGDRAA